MQARHLALLQTRLERVLEIGVAEITNTELATWFDADRIGMNVWRSIHQQWVDLRDNTKHVQGADKTAKLLVGWANDRWVFVHGQGLKSTDASWLKDIRAGAKIDYDPENWQAE